MQEDMPAEKRVESPRREAAKVEECLRHKPDLETGPG